jgi:hypothetical protein
MRGHGHGPGHGTAFGLGGAGAVGARLNIPRPGRGGGRRRDGVQQQPVVWGLYRHGGMVRISQLWLAVAQCKMQPAGWT